MIEYFTWLFSFFDPSHLVEGLTTLVQLVGSSSLLFWSFVYTVVRYTLPDVLVWLVHVVRPQTFQSPPLRKYAHAEPLVSFVIAGRNPGQSIVSCIQSVLNCDYKNVEIIFADDRSTDNSVALARTFERTGKVRVFANANHSGKPANLNLALNFVRGEFIFVLDSDTQIFHDTCAKMLAYFEDPSVGGVAASIYVRNGPASIITRFQRIEYMLTYTLTQLWRDSLGIIAIVPGMGAMFRATAMKSLGGFDMGLGDDTDLTLRLRKAGWRLREALEGRISTDVPVTLSHLMRQRARWTRNMVKMRLRKHRDMGSFRFGFANGFLFYENVVNRTVRPLAIVALALYAHLYKGADVPFIIGFLYWFTTVELLIKVLIARDMTAEPPLSQVWLVPFYILYRIPLLINQVTQVTRELLYIKTWHPYVPKRIWKQTPHH
jgi:cellulose synthase/poly-beta-1,6-N-acetylglucosamine synthase-like glycosyltransferase